MSWRGRHIPTLVKWNYRILGFRMGVRSFDGRPRRQGWLIWSAAEHKHGCPPEKYKYTACWDDGELERLTEDEWQIHRANRLNPYKFNSQGNRGWVPVEKPWSGK